MCWKTVYRYLFNAKPRVASLITLSHIHLVVLYKRFGTIEYFRQNLIDIDVKPSVVLEPS